MRYLFFLTLTIFLFSSCSEDSDKESISASENIDKANQEVSAIDQQTYDLVTAGAENVIVSYEQLLNKMLATDISKEERELLVKQSIYNGQQSQATYIFDNPNVIIEDDISPDFYTSSKIKDLKVSRYLKDLYLFLDRDNNTSVSFENIKTLQIKEGEEVFVIVYFESIINGKHSLESFPYQKTKRIATIKAEQKNKKWDYSIMSIGFYELTEVKNDSRPVRTLKKA
ncbi:MAG: hypothetical protein CMO01_27755 [Thalassobius sp.]|nr:hypothetical protein [Thalassovita sp.]|tara:strand:+ start:428 stop:1108 length:681 start_codon:yes stop_codon:yes gene_type:complete